MCLIAWDWQPRSARPLLLLANRDEFHARPAQPLHWWEGRQVLAGRDLQAGGTWLGVDRRGRLAALTNFREPQPGPDTRPSRGALVTGFLEGRLDARSYLEALAARAGAYNPFNLLVYDGERLMALESRHGRVTELPPGLGAVSNADVGTPWPKLLRLKQGLRDRLDQGRTQAADLLPLLQDAQQAPEQALPATGVPRELERLLSAIFIRSPEYGTRASSVLALGHDGLEFLEQSYGAQGTQGAVQFRFRPDPRPAA